MGLTIGSELKINGTDTRLTITEIRSMGQSEARLQSIDPPIHSGMLAEVTQWAAPPGKSLRVLTAPASASK